MIHHITKDNFNEEVLSSSVPVILDFYADWCGPCKAQGRILENLDPKFGESVKICKCNVDENEELAEQFGVQTIPTLVFYKDGQKTGQISTVLQEAGLKRMLGI